MVFKKKVWYTFCRLLIVLCLDKVKGMRTGMENIFITKLTLEKVRNLDYVEIPLAKDKKTSDFYRKKRKREDDDTE